VYRGLVPGPVLPSDLDGYHALALPAGADVRELAAAWFSDAGWEVFPLSPDLPPSGAGYGSGFLTPESRPGRLRLSGSATLVGPWHLRADDARDGGLPDRDLDLYGLPPQVADPLALGWLTATARHAGGAVVSADRTLAVVPDPAAAVDLTLWSGAVVPAPDLVATVRPYLAGARMDQPRVVADAGPGAFAVTGRFEFDGALTVAAQRRDAVPVAVAAQEWGAHGPWTYQVSWIPPDPAELEAEQPSRLHVIARSRVAPVVARVARAMWQAAGGVVVDDGGFPVPDDELARRGVRL
jgi:hypothetical protein